jgi:HAMP domain-containing protein
MNLLVRINVVLGTTLALAGAGLSYGTRQLLQANARHEVIQDAGLMMDSALATLSYTSVEVLPLLQARLKTNFLPQSVPFYAATQHFIQLREQHPEYSFKEATLNPTNPRDRATDWEADLIQKFRDDPKTQELVGERETAMGPSLYLARPIHAAAECLECHSNPHLAPASLIARYGSDNGFSWQADEVVGAHVASVPLANAMAAAEQVFRKITLWIVMSLVTCLLVVNLLVYAWVLRPLGRISAIADELSLGNTAVGDFPKETGPELTTLTRAFNRLRTSLEKTMSLLGP